MACVPCIGLCEVGYLKHVYVLGTMMFYLAGRDIHEFSIYLPDKELALLWG